ncbi:hypothetical protein ACDA63_06920 [Uliginosibacterium sp. sgz301328]|uniref:hypothetical protein n=1 Tax=Uliginosibacterium sp. sgz301328 TaxID=3243764 RepID=UPI00359E0964
MQASRDEIQANVARALACPDALWYRGLLNSDVGAGALSEAEAAAILHGAVGAAAALAQQAHATHPALSADQLAHAQGLQIGTLGDDAGFGSIPLLGQYQPGGRRVLLNLSTLARVESFIAENGLEALTPAADLRRCVLYHEVFHALEDDTPGIYTRSAMLERRLFGFLPTRRTVASASEIGAVHFSRLMAGISYCPRIFEYYLLFATGSAELDALPH